VAGDRRCRVELALGADREAIVRAAREFRPVGDPPPLFGDGHAGEHIVELLCHGATADV